MKHFVAVQWDTKRGKTCFMVYQIENNMIVNIWLYGLYRKWLTRWLESEVMDLLYDNWYIGDKQDLNWYYNHINDRAYTIQTITPRKQ